MPVVLRVDGYRFYFFSLEHPPAHVHVSKGGNDARITLVPSVHIDDNNGFKAQELRKILKLIDAHYDHLIEKWNEYQNES